MSDEQTTQSSGTNDTTSAGRTTSSKRPPRELPRRGYEDQPRPMNPPPPTPLTTEQPRQRPVSRLSDQSRRIPAPPPAAATPSVPRRGRASRPSKRDSGLYLPWWSLLVLILIAGVVSFGLLFFVLSLGGQPLGDQPAQVVILTNQNEPTLQPVFDTSSGDIPENAVIITFTPGGVPTDLVIAPTGAPTANPTETPLPGVTAGCPLNGLVAVIGTGDVGLSLRSEPRQGDNIQAVVRDGEQFRIVGGPETSTGVDGSVIEWCQVEGIEVPSRSGWAARQFLADISVDLE